MAWSCSSEVRAVAVTLTRTMRRCGLPPLAFLLLAGVTLTRGANVQVLGTLMPEEELELELMTTTALRAELRALRSVRADSRLKEELDACEANCAVSPNEPPQYRRKALSTPAPTPLTPVPSNSPSVSSAPTSEAWFQLASAVADTSNAAEIIVEEDVAFPSQSPITVDPDRSVSIVGRSADDGGRVTLRGLGASRFFVVDGGTLHLTHLNLVNGSAPVSTVCLTTDRDALLKCAGGAIVVLEDGQLIVPSCDIRGQGRRDVLEAYSGGGVLVLAFRTIVSFFNTTFQGLGAETGGAFVSWRTKMDEGVHAVATFRHCFFEGNYVADGAGGSFQFATYDQFIYLYDCVIERNEGTSLLFNLLPNCYGEIVRCVFRGNMAVAFEKGAVINIEASLPLEIRDCHFEGNVGPDGGDGGALSLLSNSRTTVINSSFVENRAGLGGAIAVVKSGASLTMIGCYARGNYVLGGGVTNGGSFLVNAATLFMSNSTIAESYAALGGVGLFIKSAIVNIKHSVFTNSRGQYCAGFWVETESSLSMTDCIHRGSDNTVMLGYIFASDSSTVYVLKNVFQNHRSVLLGGVLYARSSTIRFDDCDFIDNVVYNGGGGGTWFLRPGGHLVVTNSRVMGSSAEGEGSVAWLDVGSSMRIVDSTIMGASGEAAFAIHDESGDDFAVQFDTVTVDESVNIFSNSSVLLQNCDGFSSTTVKKADIATCESTSVFCLPSSCMDVTTPGIDCICTAGGVEMAFPTDCMQSAAIEARLDWGSVPFMQSVGNGAPIFVPFKVQTISRRGPPFLSSDAVTPPARRSRYRRRILSHISFQSRSPRRLR